MAIEDVLALTAKLGDEHKELKEQIEKRAKELNQERGKALADLNIFKEENQGLKKTKGDLEKTNMTFSDLSRALSENNMTPSQISTIAEKLRVKKDMDDELAEAKRILSEQSDKIKDYEKKETLNTLKEALQPRLKAAMEEFKDQAGNKIKLAEKFIPVNDLYKPIDVSNETLVNDRITKVLQKALTEQTNFLKETGMTFPGQEVHDVSVGDGHYGGNIGNFDLNKTLEVLSKEGGSIEAGAHAFAALRAAKEKK